MARGKRRAPAVPTIEAATCDETAPATSNGIGEDDIDEFVRQRHRRLHRGGGESNAEEEDDERAVDEFEMLQERGVMDIEVSSSDSDIEDGDNAVRNDAYEAANEKTFLTDRERRMPRLSGDSAKADNANVSESSEEERPEADIESGWGGRRRVWYGGDTQDYEIMEEEEREEALQDEEEEALRIQSKLLASLRPDDFLDSDHEDAGENEADEGKRVLHRAEDVSEMADPAGVAPEVSVLALELIESLRLMRELKSSPGLRSALLRYHVLASFAMNVAFYLSLQTDPAASNGDLRTHPVIRCIVRSRELRKACDLIDWKAYDQAWLPSSKDVRDIAEIKARVLDPEMDTDTIDTQRKAAQDVTASDIGKKRTKRKRVKSSGLDSAVDDTAFESIILGSSVPARVTGEVADNEDAARRRNFSRMVGALERERQNRALVRAAPGDMEAVRNTVVVPQQSNAFSTDAADDLSKSPDEEVDETLMERVLKKREKKEARLARKKESERPHLYRFDDDIKDKNLRRRASQQVVLNRGLTRYRPRDRKTPRTKNREAFGKAVKKRRSVVRDPVAEKPVSYGGEASGINMRARKGSKLSDV